MPAWRALTLDVEYTLFHFNTPNNWPVFAIGRNKPLSGPTHYEHDLASTFIYPKLSQINFECDSNNLNFFQYILSKD